MWQDVEPLFATFFTFTSMRLGDLIFDVFEHIRHDGFVCVRLKLTEGIVNNSLLISVGELERLVAQWLNYYAVTSRSMWVHMGTCRSLSF